MKIEGEQRAKQFSLNLWLDEIPGAEIKELFLKCLDMREVGIVWYTYLGYSNTDIASVFRIASDTVRKLYKAAENKLVNELNSSE